MFLVTMITVAPPARVSAQFVGTITIGIVGPIGSIQWNGLWEGAQLARDLINNAGGMVGPNGRYRVVLVRIDEMSLPVPRPTDAVLGLLTSLEANPDMQFLIGGFRTECVAPMEEAAMDYAASRYRPIWIIAGAATDDLVSKIQSNYDRYKYMFRVTPLNSTVMAETFGSFIGHVVAPKLAALYPAAYAHYGAVPAFVIAENLVWCDGMVAFLQNTTNQALMGIKLVGEGARRPSPLATDFSTDIAAAETAGDTGYKGAKIVVHIFSAVAGASFIRQVGDLKPKFACIGINVESQTQGFWILADGLCEYETILAPVGTRTNLNPYAKPLSTEEFWGNYTNTYGYSPIYTAWGAYDAIIALNETSYDSASGKGWTNYITPLNATNADKLILHMETLGLSDNPPVGNPNHNWGRIQFPDGRWYRNGILGLFSYTGPKSENRYANASYPQGGYHDPFVTKIGLSALDDGVVRALVVQWQAGRMEVAWPQNRTYSRKWIVPPWMYSLETDIAGGPMAPTGIPGYSYTTPDTKVGPEDMDAIAAVWFQVPPFNRLECDMQPYDHFIDVYDAAKVGMDWGRAQVPDP